MTTSPPALATPREVAAFRRTTTNVLAVERFHGTGPKFKKLGRRVLYDWADVMAWVESNTIQRTDEIPRGAPDASQK